MNLRGVTRILKKALEGMMNTFCNCKLKTREISQNSASHNRHPKIINELMTLVRTNFFSIIDSKANNNKSILTR